MYIVFDTTSCSYPNCSEDNINSHAISKNLSLQSISESQHLYQFLPRQFNKTEKKPAFKKISVLKATAHHCFCEKHDNSFRTLDTSEISTTKDIMLQVYRSLCVAYSQEKTSAISLYKLKSMDAHKNISIDAVELFLKTHGYAELIPELSNPDVVEIVQKRIQFQISEHVDEDLKELERLCDYMKQIIDYNADNADNFVDVPVGKLNRVTTENSTHTIFYYKTNFQIPISINSICHANYKHKKERILLTVVPYNTCNVIIAMIPKITIKNLPLINKFTEYFSSNFRIVEYIESIISTCDGWYIKPSIIDTMPKEKSDFLCEDSMFINERKLFDTYDLSIFNDIKMSQASEEEKTKFLNEHADDSQLPKRAPYQERYNNMFSVIEKSLGLPI